MRVLYPPGFTDELPSRLPFGNNRVEKDKARRPLFSRQAAQNNIRAMENSSGLFRQRYPLQSLPFRAAFHPIIGQVYIATGRLLFSVIGNLCVENRVKRKTHPFLYLVLSLTLLSPLFSSGTVSASHTTQTSKLIQPSAQVSSASASSNCQSVTVSTSPAGMEHPAAAYNPDRDEYRVVWEDHRSTAQTIYGHAVNAQGQPNGRVILATLLAAFSPIEPTSLMPATEKKLYRLGCTGRPAFARVCATCPPVPRTVCMPSPTDSVDLCS
jgi:hypothetical protein